VRLYDAFWAKPIEVLGGVVWNSKNALSKDDGRERFDIGVKFLNMDEKNRHRIELMIMSFELEQSKPYNPIDEIEVKPPEEETSTSETPPQQPTPKNNNDFDTYHECIM